MNEEDVIDWGDGALDEEQEALAALQADIDKGGAENGANEDEATDNGVTSDVADGQKQDVQQNEQSIRSSATATIGNAGAAKTEESSALPQGWKRKTASSGELYYVNNLTGSSTWDLPTEPAKSQEGPKDRQVVPLRRQTSPKSAPTQSQAPRSGWGRDPNIALVAARRPLPTGSADPGRDRGNKRSLEDGPVNGVSHDRPDVLSRRRTPPVSAPPRSQATKDGCDRGATIASATEKRPPPTGPANRDSNYRYHDADRGNKRWFEDGPANDASNRWDIDRRVEPLRRRTPPVSAPPQPHAPKDGWRRKHDTALTAGHRTSLARPANFGAGRDSKRRFEHGSADDASQGWNVERRAESLRRRTPPLSAPLQAQFPRNGWDRGPIIASTADQRPPPTGPANLGHDRGSKRRLEDGSAKVTVHDRPSVSTRRRTPPVSEPPQSQARRNESARNRDTELTASHRRPPPAGPANLGSDRGSKHRFEDGRGWEIDMRSDPSRRRTPPVSAPPRSQATRDGWDRGASIASAADRRPPPTGPVNGGGGYRYPDPPRPRSAGTGSTQISRPDNGYRTQAGRRQ